MKLTHLLAVLIGAIFIFGLWVSQPGVDDPGNLPAGDRLEPWEHPDVIHMAEHGLRMGPSPDGDIQVKRVGEKIQVVVLPKFIERRGEDIIPTLGLIRPKALLSGEGYQEFLDALHMVIYDEGGVHDGEEEHSDLDHSDHDDHDHDSHDHGDHDGHDHDDHDHDDHEHHENHE